MSGYAAVMARLDEMALVQAGVAQAIAGIATKQDLLAEQLGRLVAVLTPDEQKRNGPTVAEALAAFVARLDVQNSLLKDIGETVATAVRETPLAVARALRDLDEAERGGADADGP